MELNENARLTLEKRYLKKDSQGNPVETPEDMLRRVAANIAEVEVSHYQKSREETREVEETFFKLMESREFMPNSPALMNAGRELQQLSACFVLPVNDSMEEIFETLRDMALVQKTGGGTGFSFNRLRPAGDMVKSTNGVASGPVSFLKIFDATTEGIKQGGTRRGANMGVLHYLHPDILDFVTAKDREGEITNFNLSVSVSDDFMEKVQRDASESWYQLLNPRTGETFTDPQTGEVKSINARELFDMVVERAWRGGDPGLIFLDAMNRYNPTPHIGEFEATNPCVSGDTLIMTKEGPRKAEDLVGKKSTLIINGKPYSTTEAGFFPTGVKPLLSIKTREGYSLRITGNHLVLVERNDNGAPVHTEWVRAEELKPGEQIVLHCHRGLIGDIEGWDGWYGEEEGYLVGLYAGDGTFKPNQELTADLPGGAQAIGEQAVGASSVLSARNNLEGWRKFKGEKRLPLSQSFSQKIARSLGSKSEEKSISPSFGPSLECLTSSAFVRGFLRGLFDSDGLVQVCSQKGVFIKLPSKDLEKVAAVQRMLARLGIISNISASSGAPRKVQKGARTLTLIHGGNYRDSLYENCPQYQLLITKDNVDAFARQVGFYHGEKKNKLRSALNSSFRELNRESFTATVESVEAAGLEEVYDVQVPGVNAFDANGIMVHNCGEQPLLPYEACCLGSINLGLMVDNGRVDWEKLKQTVHTAVHFEDNVIDATRYVVSQIEQMHKQGNRKIGLGVMGWHDMLVQMGIPYDSQEALDLGEKVMGFINEEAKAKSRELGEERGVFPNFPGSIYDTGREEDQVRNATRTTIAPTGTISIISGASSGIEPYFSVAFFRKNVLEGVDLPEVNPFFLQMAKEQSFYGEELVSRVATSGTVQGDPEIPEEMQRLFKTAMDIDYTWHVKHQAVFQKHTDNAVSKTINLPQEVGVEEVKEAYLLAWQLGCKGITVYRDKSKASQVLYRGVTSPDHQEETISAESLMPSKRPYTLTGKTLRKETPMGNLFVTLNRVEDRPFELFAQIGKAGSDVVAFTEAIARLISLALRCGISVEEIVKQLEGIGGGRSVGFGPNRILSVPDAIGKSLRELALSWEENHQTAKRDICPECGGGTLVRAEGCAKCEACGFSEC